MKRAGIVEIYSHHVFVFTLASILRQCGWAVTVFVSSRIERDLIPMFGDEASAVQWEVKPDSESHWAYLWRVRKKATNTCDALFVNTIQGRAMLFLYFFRPNTQMFMANGRISEWFGNRYRLSGQVSLRINLHHNLTRFLTRRIIPLYSGMIVHTPQARDFAKAHGYSKTLIVLPFSLCRGAATVRSRRPVTQFVATGSLETVARDHEGLLSAFEEVWSRGQTKIGLTVLGSPRSETGWRIMRRIEELAGRGYPITFFREWIPEAVYLREIEAADVLVGPLNVDYYSCGELTSTTVEAIRLGLPCILPCGYNPDPSLESGCAFYNRIEDLSQLIESLSNSDDRLQTLRIHAARNAEQYTLENVARRFNTQLKSA